MCFREMIQECMSRKHCKDRISGYMTVEATLILSTVLMVYLFLMRSFFWIYDRCVLEQDMATLALRCANAEEDMLERIWRQEAETLDMEKYLWLEIQDPLLQKQGWKLAVTGKGEDESLGSCGVSYEIWHFTPQDWLRIKRKIGQEKETEKGETEK